MDHWCEWVPVCECEPGCVQGGAGVGWEGVVRSSESAFPCLSGRVSK